MKYKYYEPRRSALKRVWRSTWGVWSLVVLMLLTAYVLVINTMYMVIGGIN